MGIWARFWCHPKDTPRRSAIYEKAVRIDPDYGPVHYNLAGLLREAGELELARRYYEAAAESDYDRASSLARRALSQMDAEATR